MIPEFIRIWAAIIGSVTSIFLTAYFTVFYALKGVEDKESGLKSDLQKKLSNFVRDGDELKRQCNKIPPDLEMGSMPDFKWEGAEVVIPAEWMNSNDIYDRLVEHLWKMIKLAWNAAEIEPGPIKKYNYPFDEIGTLYYFIDREEYRKLMFDSKSMLQQSSLRFLMNYLNPLFLNFFKTNFNELSNLKRWSGQLTRLRATFSSIILFFLVLILLVSISLILIIHGHLAYAFYLATTISSILSVGALLLIVILKWKYDFLAKHIKIVAPLIILLSVVASVFYIFQFARPKEKSIAINSQQTLLESVNQVSNKIDQSYQIYGSNIKTLDDSLEKLNQSILILNESISASVQKDQAKNMELRKTQKKRIQQQRVENRALQPTEKSHKPSDGATDSK